MSVTEGEGEGEGEGETRRDDTTHCTTHQHVAGDGGGDVVDPPHVPPALAHVQRRAPAFEVPESEPHFLVGVGGMQGVRDAVLHRHRHPPLRHLRATDDGVAWCGRGMDGVK